MMRKEDISQLRIEELKKRISTATAGGFAELLPETAGSRQLLLARRSNGEVRAVHELSDGVRDQLYLAVRLAGLEYQLGELPEPLPVVLDDLLINFDDERSAAALEVLSELGERTQVLLFTHHEGVVTTAEAVLAIASRDELSPKYRRTSLG